MQPSKSSETIIFPINFNDFTLQRNMIFDDFPHLFRYQFLAFIFPSKGRQTGSKKRPKWDQQSPQNRIFDIFGSSGRRCFFKVFGNKKNRPKIQTNPEKNQRGGTSPTTIARPGGMRGASGEVRRG